MTQWAVFIQEGFGVESHSVYFTNESPVYEAETIPVYAISGEMKVNVGEREETFIVFTPLNGALRQKGKKNRIPFQRVLAVVEHTEEAKTNA